MALEDKQLKAWQKKPPLKTQVARDGDSLFVRISPKGKLTFFVRFYIKNQQQQITIGQYPAITLSVARSEKDKIQLQVQEGKDPRVVKKAKLVKKDLSSTSLNTVFDKWFTTLTSSEDNKKNILNNYDKHIRSSFGFMPVNEIEKYQCFNLIEGIKKNHTQTTARTAFITLRRTLSHASSVGYVKYNVIADLTDKNFGIAYQKRKRFLKPEEIRILFEFIGQDEKANNQRLKYFLFLCLFFGCRYMELGQAVKKDFDFDKLSWVTPKHKTQSRSDDIRRTLIPDIVPYIKKLMSYSAESNYLVYSIKDKGNGEDKHMCRRVPQEYIANVQEKMIMKIDYFSMHDLRRTMRTQIERQCKVNYRICETMLGHKLQGSEGHYNFNDYEDEMREGYQKWFDYLGSLIDVKKVLMT